MNDARQQEVLTADEKTRLIHEALATLRAADDIDEHVTLASSEWLAWCDAVLPSVRDIETLAAAMRLKLSVERGKRLTTDGEQRGGDQKSGIKGTKRVPLISDAVRVRRWRDRQLATHEETVNDYIRAAATAQRKPTENGALRAIKTTHSLTSRRERMGQERTASWAQKILAAVEALADGQPRSREQIVRVLERHETQRLEEFLRTIHFIPWLAVTRTAAGYVLQIDPLLRALCEGLAPRPALPDGQPVYVFLRHLRSEITRRRKENNEGYRKLKWNTEASLKKDMHALLNWIEDELTKVDTVLVS
jgi:hypothetical protein